MSENHIGYVWKKLQNSSVVGVLDLNVFVLYREGCEDAVCAWKRGGFQLRVGKRCIQLRCQ
jgi:hypothetical protein